MVICAGGWMPGNLSEGWRRLGCVVHEFFYGTQMGKSWSAEGMRANRDVNRELLNLAQFLKSSDELDLIFAVIYDDVLDVATAVALRKLNVPLVNYHVDMLGQWYRILRTGKYFDRVAAAHTIHWKPLESAGCRMIHLPMAANPHDEGEHAAASDGVLYLGSPWPFRRAVLAELIAAGIDVQIRGHNWRNEDRDENFGHRSPLRKTLHDIRHYLPARLREEGARFLKHWIAGRATRARGEQPVSIGDRHLRGPYDDSALAPLVRGAAINIGFTHSMGSGKSELRHMRLRDFEIPMCGGFYLTQHCDDVERAFSIGQHLDTWNNVDDLKEKIRFYLAAPEKRVAIATAGAAFARRHHTWAHRFRALLGDLGI